MKSQHQWKRTVAVLLALGAVLASGGASQLAAASRSPSSTELNLDATVRVANVGPVETLDPHKEATQVPRNATFHIYDRLIGLGSEDGPTALRPMLATSWEFSADGLTLTLTLRDDVDFHDGTHFDADAVVANLTRAKDEGSPLVAGGLAAIDEVVAVSPTHVEIRLTQPDAALPAALATGAGAIVSPAALADPATDLALNPGHAGSGPYVVVDFVPNDSFVLERADQPYWDPDAAKIRRLEVFSVPDDQTRRAAFEAGQFDVIQITSSMMSQLPDIEAQGFLNTQAEFQGLIALLMHATGDLADVNVRRAVAQSLDKDAIADILLEGTCTSIDGVFLSASLAYEPEYVSPYGYDPDGAIELLAGASPTIKLGHSTAGSPNIIAPAHQAMLEEVGINAQLLPMNFSDAVAAYGRNEMDGLFASVTAAPDPSGVVQYVLARGLVDETAQAEIAELATAAKAELDPDKRAQLYHDISHYLVEQAYVLPICAGRQAWAATDSIVGIDRLLGPWSGTAEFRYVGVAA